MQPYQNSFQRGPQKNRSDAYSTKHRPWIPAIREIFLKPVCIKQYGRCAEKPKLTGTLFVFLNCVLCNREAVSTGPNSYVQMDMQSSIVT